MARAGRKRSESSRQRIFSAMLELLDERGYGGITIDEIAVRAQVGKQTIYRWWRTKAEIALEVSKELQIEEVPVPNSDKLKSDLDRYLAGIVEALSQSRQLPLLRGLMAEVQLDPKFQTTFQQRFINPFEAGIRTILERAAERGEIGKIDANLICDMVLGTIWHRLLLGKTNIDQAFARSLSRMIQAALAG